MEEFDIDLSVLEKAPPDEFPAFDHLSKEVDWGGIYVSAAACHYAYFDKLSSARRLKKAGFKLDWLLTKYAEGLVAIRDDKALVVFRGSNNIEDWRSNLTASDKELDLFGETVSVHKGFWEAYAPLHEQVLDALDGFKGDVVLTGHSLGGAKALLCAMRLLELEIWSCHVHTFGQPRVGNKNFAQLVSQKLDGRYFRVVNQGDVVPYLPNSSVHVGKELHFNIQGELAEEIQFHRTLFHEASDHLAQLNERDYGPFLIGQDGRREHNTPSQWDDIAKQVSYSLLKAAAPAYAFHHTARYAWCVYQEWKNQTIKKVKSGR